MSLKISNFYGDCYSFPQSAYTLTSVSLITLLLSKFIKDRECSPLFCYFAYRINFLIVGMLHPKGPGLYEFLIEAELQQYFFPLKNDLKVCLTNIVCQESFLNIIGKFPKYYNILRDIFSILTLDSKCGSLEVC